MAAGLCRRTPSTVSTPRRRSEPSIAAPTYDGEKSVAIVAVRRADTLARAPADRAISGFSTRLNGRRTRALAEKRWPTFVTTKAASRRPSLPFWNKALGLLSTLRKKQSESRFGWTQTPREYAGMHQIPQSLSSSTTFAKFELVPIRETHVTTCKCPKSTKIV